MKYLELKNLSIGYEKTLFENINIESNLGEIIGVVGANGVGKSTLLKTIVGILPQKKGQVLIDGIEKNNYSIQRFSKIVGFSSTHNSFSSNLKVNEVVKIGRSPYTSLLGILKKEDYEIINNAIEQTGISTIANNEISKISDGQRQRAFVARLIAQKTNVLIFDEPTAFLDIEGKISIIDLLTKIAKKQNKLVIFSTHDLNVAINFCDKIWLMSNNKIISASPEDHIIQNNFSKLFVSNLIFFDNSNANFYVLSKEKKPIFVENKSSQLRFVWTLNLLKRCGLEHNDISTEKIEINDNNWIIYIKNKKYEAHSFENLQSILTKNYNY